MLNIEEIFVSPYFTHRARCAMGKVWGDKKQKRGISMYCYKFAVIG